MIKSIETYYKGYLCRSRTEARWMVAFDKIGIEFEYEPEGFDLGKAGKYLPDFYLPEFNSYAEVKGRTFTLEEIEKARQLSIQSNKSVSFLEGQPARKGYWFIHPFDYKNEWSNPFDYASLQKQELNPKRHSKNNPKSDPRSNNLKNKWELILSKLELPSTRMLLSEQAELESFDSEKITIALSPNWENMIKSRKVLIENTVKKIFGDQMILYFSTKQLLFNYEMIHISKLPYPLKEHYVNMDNIPSTWLFSYKARNCGVWSSNEDFMLLLIDIFNPRKKFCLDYNSFDENEKTNVLNVKELIFSSPCRLKGVDESDSIAVRASRSARFENYKK